MLMNNLLIGAILGGVLLIILWMVHKNNKIILDYDLGEDKYKIANVVEFVKNVFDDILRTNLYTLNLSKEDFDKKMRNRAQLRKALKSCSYGDINAKNYIKSYIQDILINSYGINEENINHIIDFDNQLHLTFQDKFEVLLHIYRKQHQYLALERLIVDNGLDALKPIEDSNGYYITPEEINDLYRKKVTRPLHFEDRLSIIVQRVYQIYKGYGVIDEIRDMKIDGVSGGVSGIPISFQEEGNDRTSLERVRDLPSSYDSVWIFLKGKTIHLSFLSFQSESELIRVCKNIYRYNNPGQLSESNGYKINEMKDGSRVVVARPPFSEGWVFFVRKFDSITKANTEDLIVDENNKLPIELIKWLIKGNRVTAITGSQGTGKTTLLMSIVKYIHPTLTLRIQELSFELQLRKIYPFRNIVSFRETGNISGQEGLNLQKKTDGSVNILGEVAEAGVASWMIQMAQVASLFTIFTHHAKTTDNLVLSIRNNLLQTGIFHNEKVAEQQVAQVINFDIHLNKSHCGHRYIERITEIIPLDQCSEYPRTYQEKTNHHEKLEAFMEDIQEFFERVTDRKIFEARDLIRFDQGRYISYNPISENSQMEIMKYLSEEEKMSFRAFLDKNWGGNASEL